MAKPNELDETEYTLLIRGSGGFFTKGEITCESANYWTGQSYGDLLIHLVHPEDYDFGPSEERFRIEDYRDNANLAFEIGFTEIEKMIVYLGENEACDQQHLNESNVIAAQLVNQNKIDSTTATTLDTRTTEWGHLVYTVKTTGMFDFDKLIFTEVVVNGIGVINKVFYEGVLLEVEEYFEQIGKLHAHINLK